MNSAIHPFSSRQRMLDENFEIHHYKDSQLGQVALHHHDFYEVYYFLSGDVSYSIESRNFHLMPQDVLLISPLELHQPIISGKGEPYERIVLWISRSCIKRCSTSRTDLGRCFNVQSPTHINLLRPEPALGAQIAEKLDTLIRARENSGYGSDILSWALLMELLVLLNRQQDRVERRYDLPDKSAPVIERALRYIAENYNREISLDSLAAHCFVSKYHLSREFHRLVGTSVYRYVIQKRLIMAKQMLLSGKSPTDVYTCCGFGDYANFYRAFRAEYGISPKKFLLQESALNQPLL